jgi:hypothetical protein
MMEPVVPDSAPSNFRYWNSFGKELQRRRIVLDAEAETDNDDNGPEALLDE